jgi:cytochrome c oxidase cbb3-type subunit I/II
MHRLGIDYPDEILRDPAAAAQAQAREIAAQLEGEQGPAGMQDRKVIALIAYLKRLGTDLNKPVDVAAPAVAAHDPETDSGAPQEGGE